MDVARYEQTTGVSAPPGTAGGQELILAEVVAALAATPGGCRVVWLPFYSTGTLARTLAQQGVAVLTDPDADRYDELPGWPIDAVYFGTPTVVGGQRLFPDHRAARGGEAWDATRERIVVRRLVGLAAAAGARRVVCGLGSGDVALEERLGDVGPHAAVLAMKCFTDATSGLPFTDWVIARDLPRPTILPRPTPS